MNDNKKNYAAIDIMKFVFALCIIGLHASFLYNYEIGYYAHTIFFRLGVPFFFIVSGFFFANGVKEERKESFFKFIKKMIPIYLVFSIFYMIIVLARSNDFSFQGIIFQLWYIITGRSLSVMWFVGSLILAALIVFHLDSKTKLKKALIVGLLLYLIGLLFNTYAFLLSGTDLEFINSFFVSNFNNNSNVIFLGFFWFGLGYYFNKYGSLKILNSRFKRILIIIIGFVLLYFEIRVVKGHLDVVANYEYYFAHLLIIPALVVGLLNINLKFNTRILRKLSSMMYYTHFIFIYLLIFIGGVHHIGLLDNPTWFYLFTCVGTIAFSYIIVKIGEKSPNKEELKKNYITFGLYFISFVFLIFTVISLINNVVWADEICSLQMARNSILDIIKINSSDVHPPGYYILLKIFIDFAHFIKIGISDIIIGKIFSLIPLIILSFFSWFKVRKLLGKVTSGVFVFLLVTIPQILYYFVEIRMYSWSLCFVTLALLYLYEIIKTNKTSSWIFFTIFSVLGAYCHLYACLAIGLLYLFLLIYVMFKNKKLLKRWLIFGGITIAFCIPWGVCLLKQFSNISGGFWIPPITFSNVVDYFKFIFSPGSSDRITNIFFGSSLFIILITSLFLLIRKNKSNYGIKYVSITGCMVLFLTIGIGVVASLIFNPVFVSRYMVGSLGCLALALSVSIGYLIDKNYKYVFILFIPLYIGICSLSGFIQTEQTKKELITPFNEYFADFDTEVNIISNNVHTEFLMSYYLQKNDIYLWKGNNVPQMVYMYKNIIGYSDLETIKELKSNDEQIYFIEYVDGHDYNEDFENSGFHLEFKESFFVDIYNINVYEIMKVPSSKKR